MRTEITDCHLMHCFPLASREIVPHEWIVPHIELLVLKKFTEPQISLTEPFIALPDFVLWNLL